MQICSLALSLFPITTFKKHFNKIGVTRDSKCASHCLPCHVTHNSAVSVCAWVGAFESIVV